MTSSGPLLHARFDDRKKLFQCPVFLAQSVQLILQADEARGGVGRRDLITIEPWQFAFGPQKIKTKRAVGILRGAAPQDKIHLVNGIEWMHVTMLSHERFIL